MSASAVSQNQPVRVVFYQPPLEILPHFRCCNSPNPSNLFPTLAVSHCLPETKSPHRRNRAMPCRASLVFPPPKNASLGDSHLKKKVQDGSKSVSPLTHRDSFSNPPSKHAMPITVTLPLPPVLGSIPLEEPRGARIGPETMKWSGRIGKGKEES